jgi:hypothetical protein
MKKIKYSEKDMAALISEVEAQFTNHLAKAEKAQPTDLKKSEAAEQPKAEETPVVEAAPKEQGFDYDEEDIKEMNEMYSSMTKAEAEAHFESLKKVISKEEETKPETKAEEVVAKSEVKAEEKPEAKDEETKLLKSEVESLKSDKEKLEKSLKDLTAALAKYVKGTSAPKQKAITRIEFVAKSEEEKTKTEEKSEDVSKLDKTEISKRLTAKIRSGKLEKAEREKINEFYQTGSKNIESIRHLLTGGN